MEITDSIVKLYRHWDKHTEYYPLQKTNTQQLSTSLLSQIEDFATERMNIWYRKITGNPFPYTDDTILTNYRFCNIYRELDKQTIEIHKVLNPHRDDFDYWLLNLAFNRFLCNPETFKVIGFLSFSDSNNNTVYKKLVDLPRPKYGSAYVFPISVIQNKKHPTRELFFTKYLPEVIPKISNVIQKLDDSSVVSALSMILPVFGYNMKFHWTEILI